MNQVSEFRNKEIAFLSHDKSQPPKRGYNITNSENLEELQKILKIENKQYNTYVTIATYSEALRLPINPKTHWPLFKQWVTKRDQTITNIDFILDFDSTPTIEGLKQSWKDAIQAKEMLYELLGEQAKWLTTWFSGNKGFHILGKCKITTTAQDIIDKQLNIAMQIQSLCPTLDTTIYDTARLRKLLGSHVYSTTFGQTRVIPIQDNSEFEQLIKALKTKNENWFDDKPLTRLNNICL